MVDAVDHDARATGRHLLWLLLVLVAAAIAGLPAPPERTADCTTSPEPTVQRAIWPTR